jgi:serine/threonine protein kinase
LPSLVERSYARGVTPATVGPYEVLSVLGRGGLATVYRARHRASDRHVALKLVAAPGPDLVAARRLAREFEALARLDHPNVIRVFEAGVHEGCPFLAMELVQGLDLRSYLSPTLDEGVDAELHAAGPAAAVPGLESWTAEPQTESLVAAGDPELAGEEGESASAEPGEPLPQAALDRLNRPSRLARLRDAIVQVCDALAYVHAHGLVHRDLKPSNIMVDDFRRVKLMDFGLVEVAGGATPDGHEPVVGTYRYMAPEQADGEPVDHRADLYSLGVILFEIACGRVPRPARRASRARGEVPRKVPPLRALNPGVDGRLAYVTERLLARAPCERFSSARDVAAALRGEGG